MEFENVNQYIQSDLEKLKLKTESIELEEGEKIAAGLYEFLLKKPTTKCVAANQLGINKQVAMINIKEPLSLINPVILEQSIKLTYLEDDVCFPNQLFKTERYVNIIVQADNFEEPIFFGLHDGTMKLTDTSVMESIAIQHMVDSLNGILITERTVQNKTYVNAEKIGRNEIVTLINGNEELKIKYKFIDEYKKLGWTLKK